MTRPAAFRQDFTGPGDSFGSAGRWRKSEIGAGAVMGTASGLRLTLAGAMTVHYSNAQLDDYGGLPRSGFPWRPPARLRVRARFSHSADVLKGTAGFGFWNDFFMSARAPTLPRAAWFFYASPPSDLPFDVATPGHGWKAATIDALRPSTPLMLASALPAALLMRAPGLYRRVWPVYQRALRICEAPIPAAMDAWHTYELEWRPDAARFTVDGETVLVCPAAPAGPLGLVMWMDNQYLVATPQGRLRHGLVEAQGEQWLEVAWVEAATD